MRSADAIEQFLSDRAARGCRPATMTYYTSQLGRLARTHPELPETPAPLRELLARVKGAPASRHTAYRALRALYQFLAADDIIGRNPMTRVAPPRVPTITQRTLDRVDVARLLALDLTDRDRAIISLILDAGIRSGEIRRLRARDIHDGWITVTGKSGDRPIPIHRETLDQLRELARARQPEDPVFRNTLGSQLSRERLNDIVAAALHQAGLDQGGKHGAHLLRHSFGRHWIESGGSMPALQRLMGHASILTTAVYTNLAIGAIADQHDQYSQLAQPKKLRRVV